jgi:lysophospholipase L1-like esterase
LNFCSAPIGFESRIDLDFLAADCFHPNAAGQADFAERLWADQPWFKN